MKIHKKNNMIENIEEFLDYCGGHICSFTFGWGGGSIVTQFTARITKIEWSWSGHHAELHTVQHNRNGDTMVETYGLIKFDPTKCKIDMKSTGLVVKAGEYNVPVHIGKLANSQFTSFHNGIKHKPKERVAAKTKNPLECPVCGKECSSTSGFTLHRKNCK